MGRQKPDKYKQEISNLVPPPEYRIMPRDSEIYQSTSPWQIMTYEYELGQKRRLVEELFSGEAVDEVKTDGKDFFYRNKMEYALYWDNAEKIVRLAFHQRNSHRKIPFVQSSIERPEILATAHKVIAELNQEGKEARAYQSLMIRCSQQGEVAVALYENYKPRPVLPPLTDVLFGVAYSYSPNGFFQINLPVYEMVLREIKEYIKTDKVLDLYAGVGTIGLSVARERDLTLVEVDKSAYDELENNATGTNARTVLAKSEDVLGYITDGMTVILDPPRAGCNAALISRLNEQKVPMIVYLSCNPVTQARDIAMLKDNYRISKIQPYNFFPRTTHIENLVVLVAR
jgi:23S rRNA (uracil1939-C5)-methyltransferase